MSFQDAHIEFERIVCTMNCLYGRVSEALFSCCNLFKYCVFSTFVYGCSNFETQKEVVTIGKTSTSTHTVHNQYTHALTTLK
jgi:hypothetical protein